MYRKLIKLIGVFTVIVVLFSCYANFRINSFSKDKLFSNSKNIPHNKIGLLLGTSKYVARGRVNLYYLYRIKAAVALFRQKKIDFILVSGDNGNKNYNEPKKIKEDLITAGVPENKIVLDYAGFRTLDSVVRASKVFGENSFTVISQRFHNERAIYLASKFGSNAIGFNAKDVSKRYGLKVKIREYFARVKVFIDLLFDVQPKFLGKKIKIND